MPGQSTSVEVGVPSPFFQSLHYVAMYGKTKELCSTISISSQALRSLKPTESIIQTDQVISAGAATDPVLPAAMSATTCQGSPDAVSCLRTLSTAKSTQQIHYFAGYLPSLLDFLESKYGSADVLTLLVPSSGSVHYSLSSK
jgi:hypothetical protein